MIRYMTREDENRLRRADGKHAHPYMPELADLFARGRVDRRTFLRQASLLGVSVASAHAFLGAMTGERMGNPARAATKDPSKMGGELRWSSPVREITDPHTFFTERQCNMTRHVVEHLTETDARNVTHPGLARSWEASDDLKTWTFHLREGVTWSNGDSFTADDVVYNIRRWMDLKTGSYNRTLFFSLLETVETGKTDEKGNPVTEQHFPDGAVEKIDDHTVRLNLRKADVAIPENFFNYPTAILHRRFDEQGGDFKANPVGTGPFALTMHEVGEAARLEKRDAPHWKGEPYIDALQYVDHGDDAMAAMAALASGQVHVISNLNPPQLPQIEAMDNLVIQSVDAASTGVARMRVDKEPFNDKRVRQAMAACLDHQTLLDLAHGGHGEIAENHHVAPIHPDYYALPDRQQDYERARQLLKDAGHGDGLTIEVAVGNTTGPWETSLMQAMREQMRPAGITLKINTMPSSNYWDIWKTVPFGFTTWLHRPLGTMVLNLAYRQGAAWNETAYSNPEFEAALDEANQYLDPNERKKKMEKVERILQDDAAIIQPLWRRVFSASSKRVKNFQRHPSNYHIVDDIWMAEA